MSYSYLDTLIIDYKCKMRHLDELHKVRAALKLVCKYLVSECGCPEGEFYIGCNNPDDYRFCDPKECWEKYFMEKADEDIRK